MNRKQEIELLLKEAKLERDRYIFLIKRHKVDLASKVCLIKELHLLLKRYKESKYVQTKANS